MVAWRPSITQFIQGPIQEQYHHITPALCQEVNDLSSNMLQSEEIQESRSPWAAPVVLARKEDGSL